jgi:hypothetical protein
MARTLRGPAPVLYAAATICAAMVGLASDHLYPAVIGMVTLLPVASHVRHVGWRHAVSDPSPIPFIVAFYLLFFPVRGLVVALAHEQDLSLPGLPVSSGALVFVLMLAAACTTTLVEAYYLTRRWQPTLPRLSGPIGPVVRLNYALSLISLAALAVEIRHDGGVGAARALYYSHSIARQLAGNATASSTSAWSIFSVPAVWTSAAVLFNPKRATTAARAWAASSTVIILAMDLYIFGSRLSVTLGLIGAWIIFRYCGRRVPDLWLAVALVAGILLSQPLLSSRTTALRSSRAESLSRVAGYGVLDVMLAIHREPWLLQPAARNLHKWEVLPEYFVPAFLWPSRPNIALVSLGHLTAVDYGAAYDADTSFPATYITEAWLIAGVPGAIGLSLLFGAGLGYSVRKLVGRGALSQAALLVYCFVAVEAWDYFKDGNLLVTLVGDARAAIYLGALMWVFGAFGVSPSVYLKPNQKLLSSASNDA